VSKSLEKGTAYLVGIEPGPIKIGVTSRRPHSRYKAAQKSFGNDYWVRCDYEIDLYGTWPHQYAYMIEKLAHMHLMDHHITGEWFDVSIHKARKTVARVIRLLNTGWKSKVTKGDWFARHGLKDKDVINCFGMNAKEVMAKYNRLVRLDWGTPIEEKQEKLRQVYNAKLKRKANAKR
jgi:uncharacterized protein YacL (UPF0231 family)